MFSIAHHNDDEKAMMMLRSIVFASTLVVASSFAPNNPIASSVSFRSPQRSATQLFDGGIYVSADEMNAARSIFWVCTLAATGSAATGREILPAYWKRLQNLKALAGQGMTAGGKTLGLNPLAGYGDIPIADVQPIVNNEMTVQEMIDEYQDIDADLSTYSPERQKFAYFLKFDSFCEANEGANPLALRAIFDTFGQGASIAEPVKTQRLLYEYQQDINKLKPGLENSKLLSLAAILVLCIILGTADGLCLYHVWKGWFPAWPGGETFPSGMFDPETGISAIPKYWMGDTPSADGFF